MKICVFGASSDELDPAFFELGEALGRAMAARGHTLVFGGGAHGLMGAAARGAAANGGRIVGVAPWFFDAPGILYENCTELVRMDTMAERKTIMRERSDAFIALPGGIGTMEEVLEVITLRTLGRMGKPVAFLDTEGYWLPTVEALRMTVEKGFAKPGLMEAFDYFTEAEACLDYLEGKSHDL